MEKPRNYDNTQAYGDYEPLPPGGYECTVCKVEEVKSKKGKEMLNIWLDISRGEYRNYFKDAYKSDTRDDKKWGCIVYQLTNDNNGNCNRGLKSFISCIAASNPGFDEDSIWGDKFESCFKDLSVGGVFRREQYKNRSGKLRMSTKCFKFCPVQEAESQAIPEDKLLDSAPSYMNNSGSALSEVSDDDYVELPF